MHLSYAAAVPRHDGGRVQLQAADFSMLLIDGRQGGALTAHAQRSTSWAECPCGQRHGQQQESVCWCKEAGTLPETNSSPKRFAAEVHLAPIPGRSFTSSPKASPRHLEMGHQWSRVMPNFLILC